MIVAFLTVASLAQAQSSYTADRAATLALSRKYYLNELIQPHNYAPGKNSFLFQTLHRGQRKTVLELAGSGSVRHIWSTWSIPGSDTVPPGRVLLRMFVNGESAPSITGTIDEIFRAAQNTGTSFVPFPSFIYKDGYNFYLLIYFNNGIKIEIEALDEINEFYTQIDYRLGANDRHASRLVSRPTPSGVVLKYEGKSPLALDKYQHTNAKVTHASAELNCLPSTDSCESTIEGPGILRTLTIRGDAPPDLELQIYWDDEVDPSVYAPTKYFFADFVNAAMESAPGEMTTYFPMPFHRNARIILRSASKSLGHLGIEYAIERRPIAREVPYFHALYHDTQKTPGYSQYPVLQIRGKGVFVGINLFDSGHNHGGGDAALIDAGTAHPHVLHGICGEDYFGFAWHHTGEMTPLTGAPVHEQRYRLHLENPYPFTESFQLLFGTFAGLQPKSVAFWYQVPATSKQDWISLDVPWKVLGPVGVDTPLPDAVGDQSYKTTVPINNPTELTARWQDAQMVSGFVDLTYQFRHYVLIERGSGFVAGASRTKLITYVYSPSDMVLNAILGHDDEVVVRLSGADLSDLPQQSGFGPSSLRIPLRKGWNTLDLVLSNDENVNWRWSGLSLALQRGQDQGLKFSSVSPCGSSTPVSTTGH